MLRALPDLRKPPLSATTTVDLTPRFPSTAAAADDLTRVPLEEEFLEGLQFILDGVDRARRRRSERRT